MNWKNSNFQIFYHVLGNCHTMVEGLRVMYELRQDRLFSIKSSLAESKRSEAKVLAAKKIIEDKAETPAQKLTSLCNIEEQDARSEIAQPCYDAARHELAFIEYLIGVLEKNIPYHVGQTAFQQVQALENAYDICVRAHTNISMMGSPSAELINEARNSPYRVQIMKAIDELMSELADAQMCGKRLAFLSMSKVEVLALCKLDPDADYPLIDITKIELPKLETLECKAFPLRLTVSTS